LLLCVSNRSQALLGDVVDDVEDTETPSVGELVGYEVQRPPRIWPRFHQDRQPYAAGLAAGAALAHGEPFFPIEPVDAVNAESVKPPEAAGLHRLEIRRELLLGAEYVVAYIRLFYNSGAPEYRVVVGTSTKGR
jgi:hypothetical protein